jgi:S1-C subfamily serine protease
VEFFTKRNAPVPAEVLPGAEGGDEIRGLALLMVKGKENIPSGLSALLVASNIRLSGGEDIILIGFPRGVGPWAVIKGNISSRQGRDIYFSPTVGEGNSGGPIIQNGKVVGLVGAGGQLIGQGVTARSIEAHIDGFGITLQETAPANITEAPSTMVKPWDNVLVSLKVQELNSTLRRELNIPINVSGLMVNYVDPGGAAEKSGVQRGDIVTEVNHTRISNLSQYHAIAGTAKKNETVVLLLNRRGNDLAIAIQP